MTYLIDSTQTYRVDTMDVNLCIETGYEKKVADNIPNTQNQNQEMNKEENKK